MPQEEIIKLPHGSAKKMVKEGSMTIVDQKRSREEQLSHSSLEEAEHIFGKDFIGEAAIRDMEKRCKAKGIVVLFLIHGILFPYNFREIKEELQEYGTDRERFCVLRPKGMWFQDDEGSYDGPITIKILERLFKNINPFGTGTLVDHNHTWYKRETFFNNPLQGRYAMPTKKPLPESLGINWSSQEPLLKPGESRREAVEIYWDTIAYYAATGQRLLADVYDWSKTIENTHPEERHVFVENPSDRGISPDGASYGFTRTNLGFCPTR